MERVRSHSLPDPASSVGERVVCARPEAGLGLEVEGTLSALGATGMPFYEAMAHVVEIYDGVMERADLLGLVRPAMEAFLEGRSAGDVMVRVLDQCARLDPVAANDYLGKVLSTGDLLPWPDGAGVMGIRIGRRDWISSLPTGLRVPSHFDIQGCLGLTGLPQGLFVGGDLGAEGCTSLRDIPDDLKVLGDCLLSGCTALEGLPPIDLGGSMVLDGCTSLREVPVGMKFPESLSLNGCSSLTRLPDGLKVGWDLDLERCVSLKGLPQGLYVECLLTLVRCNALTALPSDMAVATLILRDCPAWDGVIPEDAKIVDRAVVEGERIR